MTEPKLTTQQYLSHYLRHLRNGNPEAYDQFMRVYDVYLFEVLNAMTAADQSQILQRQGQAQQAKVFLQILMDARKEPKSEQ